MNALTATAARNGDPTASMPKMISATPHKMDNVEACRTIPDGACRAINTSSKRDELLSAVVVSPRFRRLMEMGASPDLRHWS
jgi:hypothetical protein